MRSKDIVKEFYIECSICSFYDILHGTGLVTQKDANGRFKEWGWRIGKQDICPSCIKKEKEKKNGKLKKSVD